MRNRRRVQFIGIDKHFAVSTIILLLLFHLFGFIFYYETAARADVATLWNNLLMQDQDRLHDQDTNKTM